MGGLTLALAQDMLTVVSRAAHIDAHSLKFDAWLAREIQDIRQGPHGLTVISRKPAGDQTLIVRAERDGITVGDRALCLEGHEATYVLAEDVVSGASFLEDEWIGKGVGAFLYQVGDELIGLRSTPHGRFGALGMLTDIGAEFWRKRAARQAVPGDGDPEGVARRLAEVNAVHPIQWAERAAFLDVEVAVAMAAAIGGEPAVSVHPDGDAKGWAISPDGRTLTTRGWDSVPDIESKRARVRKGFDEARGHSGLLSTLHITKGESPLVAKAAAIALALHHDPGWTPARVAEAVGDLDGMRSRRVG